MVHAVEASRKSRRSPAKQATAVTHDDVPLRQRADEEIDEAVATLVRGASRTELDRVVAATSPEAHATRANRSGAEPDEALWGPAPDQSTVATATLANLRKAFLAGRELEEISLSRAQAAELLGISEQAVTAHLEAGRLLGLKRGRRWTIPAWQFDAEAERGFASGIAEVRSAFPGGIVALSRWVSEPQPDLDGRTPQVVLSRGAVKDAVAVAQRVASAGW